MLDAPALRVLLSDPKCPYGRDANDIVSALRENRSPARTRWIHQTALLNFIAERTGEAPLGNEVDEMMLNEIGAKHVRLLDLDGLARRTVRRLIGRPDPASVMYEVPEVP